MINESISCKEKLHVVFNTNERNFPIVNLALKYFCHHNSPDGFNVSVIANKLPKTDLLYTDRVNYISGDIGFCPSGTHFGTTITKALNQIKEEFIFFFCDDYILTKHIDLKKLNILLSMIEKEQIDYFSFASSDPERFNFKKYEVKDVYDIEKDKFYIIPPDFRHAYSVQPCIWKKSSLQELLKHNPNLTLHAMDNSSIADKSGYYRQLKDDVLRYNPWPNPEHEYNFKMLSTSFKIFDLCCPPENFIIEYREVIRHGAFHIKENGFDSVDKYHGQEFVTNLIREEKLELKPEYAKYLPKKI